MLASIGAIALAISDLIMVGGKVIALLYEARKKGWVKDGRSLRDRIKNSQSDEERMALARDLFGHEPK